MTRLYRAADYSSDTNIRYFSSFKEARAHAKSGAAGGPDISVEISSVDFDFTLQNFINVLNEDGWVRKFTDIETWRSDDDGKVRREKAVNALP